MTPTLVALFAYAETPRAESTALTSKAQRELQSAVLNAWDGTKSGLSELQGLLRHVQNLSKVRRPP